MSPRPAHSTLDLLRTYTAPSGLLAGLLALASLLLRGVAMVLALPIFLLERAGETAMTLANQVPSRQAPLRRRAGVDGSVLIVVTITLWWLGAWWPLWVALGLISLLMLLTAARAPEVVTK